MFRKMRRFRQQLPEEENVQILKEGSHAVLALHGDDDYPYAVPVSYVYEDGKIYFHGAKAGHKVDAINKDEKVSLCVVAADDVVASEATTYFKSVIAFGRVRQLTGESEIRAAAVKLGEKYSHAYRKKYMGDIDRQIGALACFEISIEHLTGKEAVELTAKRR